MKTKLLVVLFMLCSQVFFAQQRTCGVDEAMQTIMSDPIQRAVYLEGKARFEEEYQRLLTNFNRNGNETNSIATITRIPIAIHYQNVTSSPSTALKTCLTNLAQTQINILNADYNATNTDLTLWNNPTTGASQYFPGVNIGDMDIQFELATQNHPAGFNLVNGEPAITFGYDFGGANDIDSAWAGYFNIVVRTITQGWLGFSPLPGDMSGRAVTIDRRYFSSGTGCGSGATGVTPTAPFNKGRTLTHEFGHYFSLDHTFVSCDGSNCATSGDRVCDTPTTAAPTYQCPSPDATYDATCAGELVQTMNYMDYTNDACMYMFSAGQATRMTAWLNTVRSQIRQNALSNSNFVKNNFSIYPNPNKGEFTIQFKELLADFAVEVFDVTGRVVFEKTYNQNSELSQNIVIQNPTRGVYFANIKSGNNIITNKIIIE